MTKTHTFLFGLFGLLQYYLTGYAGPKTPKMALGHAMQYTTDENNTLKSIT